MHFEAKQKLSIEYTPAKMGKRDTHRSKVIKYEI